MTFYPAAFSPFFSTGGDNAQEPTLDHYTLARTTSYGGASVDQAQETPDPRASLIEQVRSVTHEQIAFISDKIVRSVMNNLGQTRRKEINDFVVWGKPMVRSLTQTDFFHDAGFSAFLAHALPLVIGQISATFKNPRLIVYAEKLFDIADYTPHQFQFIGETAKALNVAIDLTTVPNKYYVILTVDPELTRKNSALTFTLSQRSHGVEFEKETFTLQRPKHEELN